MHNFLDMKLDIQDLKVLLNWAKHTAVAHLEGIISPVNPKSKS